MRLRVLMASVLLLPSVAIAQRGGGGGGGGGGGRGGATGAGGVSVPRFMSTKDLQEFNAASAILDDRKKLKLTDEQVKMFEALHAKIAERNADLFTRYDSVKREYKVPQPSAGGTPTESDRQKLAASMQQIRVMMSATDQLAKRRSADVKESLDLLDESQRARGTKVLDDQTKDMTKKLPKMPGRGGGGGDDAAPSGRRGGGVR